MTRISLIGCGRWGTFLGWYAANYGKCDGVDMYDIPTSPNFIELKNTRKNSYLSLSDNMELYDNLQTVLQNDFVIVSVGCQYFRGDFAGIEIAEYFQWYPQDVIVNCRLETFVLPGGKEQYQQLRDDFQQHFHDGQ